MEREQYNRVHVTLRKKDDRFDWPWSGAGPLRNRAFNKPNKFLLVKRVIIN